MIGDKLGLHSQVLTADWQVFVAAMCCNAIELTADVEWQWRTNVNASRTVPAGVNHVLVANGYRPEKYEVLCRFAPGEEICEVKGMQTGTLWIKSVR